MAVAELDEPLLGTLCLRTHRTAAAQLAHSAAGRVAALVVAPSGARVLSSLQTETSPAWPVLLAMGH